MYCHLFLSFPIIYEEYTAAIAYSLGKNVYVIALVWCF